MIEHNSKIPVDKKLLVKLINMLPLTKVQKKLLYIHVNETIKAMNETGMYKYFPDKHKDKFTILFLSQFTDNEEYYKLIQSITVQLKQGNEK